MGQELELGADEIVAGRPFTDPLETRRDVEALGMLLAHERERARGWSDDALGAHSDVVVSERDPEGRRHLLVVPDARALLEAPNPVVVGFFGRPRADANAGVLFDLEEELVGRMGAHARTGLLSYYDVEMVKGAYGNLILFADSGGPENWAKDRVHERAVAISPQNYHRIRLHHGRLTGRLLDDGALRVTRTRYLDYDGPEPWRAVRHFPEGLSTRGDCDRSAR